MMILQFFNDSSIENEDSSVENADFYTDDSEDEEQEERPNKDPMFKMESCTLHVRGIPADTNCDQDWLREVFGVFGDFIQGTIRRPREGLDYALISFRDMDDVQELLNEYSAESLANSPRKPSRCIPKKHSRRSQADAMPLSADGETEANDAGLPVTPVRFLYI